MSQLHRKTSLKSRRTAIAIACYLVATGGAFAQDSDADGTSRHDAPPKENVVTVTGTRQSVASAIERKIRNDTVSDSLVAEDINQFPDKNVGEALSRITGVQLSRDFGEGSQVSIRGVQPDLNRVEINGQSVLATGGTAGRGAELRELASELIQSIDVYKGTTADLTEGGVGGTVIIQTRKPLDFKKKTVAVTLSGEQATSRGGVQPRASLLLADKYLDGKLGLMANVVYDKVYTRNDYARNTSWRFLRDWDFSPDKTVTSLDPAVAAVTTPGGCNASTLSAAQKTACQSQWFDYSPGIARYGIWTRDHERSSAEFTAQYEFNKGLRTYVSYEDNTQSQRLNDRNFGTDFSNVNRLFNAGTAPVYNATTGVPTTAGTCNAVPTASTPDGVTVANHYVTQYTVGSCLNIAGQGGQGAFGTSARDFSLKVRSQYLSNGWEWKSGDWEAKALINTSKSRYSSESNQIALTQNAPGLKVSLDSQGLPHFDFPSGYSPDANSSYVQVQLQYRPSETKNTEDQAKLDFKYRLKTPFFQKLWFGVQGRKTTAQQYNGGGYLASNGKDLVSTADDINVVSANVNQTLIYDPLNKTGAQRAPDTQSFLNANYSTKYIDSTAMQNLIATIRGTSPSTFFKGYNGVSGMPSNWMTPVYSSAVPYFDTSHFNYANLYNAPGSDGKTYPQIPAYSADERITAGYSRLDFSTEVGERQIFGNIGIRYTRTQERSTGLAKYQVRTENSPGSSTYTDRVVTNGIATVENTYHDWMPSVNAAMWLIPDSFLARVGWGKVMARPSIDLLVPNATCTAGSGNPQFGGDGTDDCKAGNPDLKPYRATNTDLSLEYYPSADTQISAGFFKKEITSYIVNAALVKNVNLFGDGNLFDVTQPINGKGATTKGVELTARTALTMLPGWLSGFGIDTNYTRMTFKFAPGTELTNPLDGTALPYPGLSKNSYNVALWYDRDKYNARLAYTYRDRFYTGVNDVSGNPNFQEKTGFLDAKFQYRLNQHWTFSVEGKNLTDEAQITDAGDLFRVNELAFSGRRYFVSLSYKN
ncbi:TonB-dependent receptor [Pseudoduganella sp. RAF19]|uniref:TonB-dependent receptor n=3 Tax=unclassified Pseudoduganella TaxID=2637179 RepID=UPI003F9930D5